MTTQLFFAAEKIQKFEISIFFQIFNFNFGSGGVEYYTFKFQTLLHDLTFLTERYDISTMIRYYSQEGVS